MKTFLESGIMTEMPCFLNESDTFYIQELEGDCSDKYVYPGDSIKYDLDAELVCLYDKFRFLKIQMHTIKSWILFQFLFKQRDKILIVL
mgnify:CR=1 FL=1